MLLIKEKQGYDMSVKVYAVIFGILFLLLGILGFFPVMAPNGYLLNMFMVSPVHSLLHLITGIIALFVAFSAHFSRAFFRIFGIIYVFFALLAILIGNNFVFFSTNHADNLFHLVIGAMFLYFGFGKPRHPHHRSTDMVKKGEVRHVDRVGPTDHVSNSDADLKQMDKRDINVKRDVNTDYADKSDIDRTDKSDIDPTDRR